MRAMGGNRISNRFRAANSALRRPSAREIPSTAIRFYRFREARNAGIVNQRLYGSIIF